MESIDSCNNENCKNRRDNEPTIDEKSVKTLDLEEIVVTEDEFQDPDSDIGEFFVRKRALVKYQSQSEVFEV